MSNEKTLLVELNTESRYNTLLVYSNVIIGNI